MIERVLATDMARRARQSQAQARPRSSSATRASPSTCQRTRPRVAAGQGRPVREAFELSRSIAMRSTRSCSTASSWSATSGSTRTNPTTRRRFPVPKRDVAKAKALLKEAGVTGPHVVDLMVPNNRRPAGRRGAAVDGRGDRLRSQDPRHRVRDLAEAGRERRVSTLSDGWSGRSDPDGNSYIFHACGRRRTTPAIATRTSTPGTTKRASRAIRPSARRSMRTITAKYLAPGSIKYLYHRRVLVALSDKVEGYRQMPDGLIRVVGVKLK
jgi:peptide/nickel transport system substrate-binding protein